MRVETLLNPKSGRKHKIEEVIQDLYNLQTLSGLSAVGLVQEAQQEPCHRQGPLPDLLPQTEHLSRLSIHRRGPGDSTVRRVAIQLRTIGDEFNATILHRVVSVET